MSIAYSGKKLYLLILVGSLFLLDLSLFGYRNKSYFSKSNVLFKNVNTLIYIYAGNFFKVERLTTSTMKIPVQTEHQLFIHSFGSSLVSTYYVAGPAVSHKPCFTEAALAT